MIILCKSFYEFKETMDGGAIKELTLIFTIKAIKYFLALKYFFFIFTNKVK